MKSTLLFTATIFALFIGYTSLTGSSNGRAAAANEGNTGAPGDAATTCVSCHNGGPISTGISIHFKDSTGTEVTEYIPNKTYTLEVILMPTAGSPSGYGYQMVALEDAGNTAINSWTSPNSNVKISSANGRRYVEQNGVSSSDSFETQWTAPSAGTGSVTFYTAGNAVNGNGTTLGDGAAKTSLTIGEDGGVPSSVELLSFTKAMVYPNHARDFISVSNFVGTVEIIDLTGKTVAFETVNSNFQNVNIADLKKGNYFIKIVDEYDNATIQKLVKL